MVAINLDTSLQTDQRSDTNQNSYAGHLFIPIGITLVCEFYY